MKSHHHNRLLHPPPKIHKQWNRQYVDNGKSAHAHHNLAQHANYIYTIEQVLGKPKPTDETLRKDVVNGGFILTSTDRTEAYDYFYPSSDSSNDRIYTSRSTSEDYMYTSSEGSDNGGYITVSNDYDKMTTTTKQQVAKMRAEVEFRKIKEEMKQNERELMLAEKLIEAEVLNRVKSDAFGRPYTQPLKKHYETDYGSELSSTRLDQSKSIPIGQPGDQLPNITDVQSSGKNQSTVTTLQPMPQSRYVAQQAPMVYDFRYLSVFSFLCCCFPIGAIAIVYAFQSKSLADKGHYEIAMRKSLLASKCCLLAITCGIFIYLAVAAFISIHYFLGFPQFL